MGVTRKERLLKAILEDNATACGGGVTREERMLAGVAKKSCDNDVMEGGGMPNDGAPNQQMVTDANGVAKFEDRTHYVNAKEDVYAEEQTVVLTEVDTSYEQDGSDVRKIGEITLLKELPWWQDVRFDVTVNGVINDETTYNNYMDVDGGELYGYTIYPKDGKLLIDCGKTSADSCTIKIAKKNYEYFPLDEKFIPDIARPVYISITSYNSDITYFEFENDVLQQVGNVKWSDVDNWVKKGRPFILVNNAEVFFNRPRKLSSYDYQIVFIDTSEEGIIIHEYLLSENNSVTKTSRTLMDETSLYIKSSTKGSEKKFKISVDDSGTISATEV